MDKDLIFKKIFLDTIQLSTEQIKKVLIVYEEPITFLGDCCIRFDKLRYLKSFLHNAFIQINFSDKRNAKYYEGLLKGNPYIDKISEFEKWDDIQLEDFDLIFSVMYDEGRLLNFIQIKYGDKMIHNELKLGVYSLSNLLLKSEPHSNYIFPSSKQLTSYLKELRPGEVHISESERLWADAWLESQGIKHDEQLFIMLDSTSTKEKLLNITVYFDLLRSLLGRPKTKVLIFDERGLSKDAFYREWLGDETDKMIFSRGLTLRQDLSLISSKYVKMIFGPCTGLMHCASGIYNSMVTNGRDPFDTPLMIVYTGTHGDENYNVNTWWGASPLIKCLCLKYLDSQKVIVLLEELTDEEKNSPGDLPCEEYTFDLLYSFIMRHLKAAPKSTPIMEQI